jgi:gamma-glutamylcyclotransferase (GGCT)/AIG2-like uncharacterized protein YtfP
MKKRCPDSCPVTIVKLKGYKLEFNRYADIIESEKGIVYGAVYSVSDMDIKNLDKYEGYPRLYTKVNVIVEDEFGEIYEAFVYVMTSKGRKEPQEDYYNIIKQGFMDWDLPIQNLVEARNQIE